MESTCAGALEMVQGQRHARGPFGGDSRGRKNSETPRGLHKTRRQPLGVCLFLFLDRFVTQEHELGAQWVTVFLLYFLAGWIMRGSQSDDEILTSVAC